MAISGVIAGCIESTFTGVVSGKPAGGDVDPNIAEIVAMLTAGGDAWELDSVSSPQTGVLGALSLTVNGSALTTTGKVGSAHYAEYGAGPCCSGAATNLIAAVFDGGDWSVNAWHKPEFSFSVGAVSSVALNVYTSTGIPCRITCSSSGTPQLDVYVSDVDDSGAISFTLPITNNAWSMITLTYDSATRELLTYVNASLESTDVLPDTTSTDFTGNTGQQYEVCEATANGSSEAFAATDLLLICEGVLTQANIDYLYNSGAGRANSTFA